MKLSSIQTSLLITFSNLLILILVIFFSGCTEPRIKRYEGLLENKVGNSKKEELDKILGNPSSCKTEAGLQKCEYRTMAGRNNPTPGIFKKQEGMGPDVSPYEYFDVIHLFYDEKRVLKEWHPIVIRP